MFSGLFPKKYVFGTKKYDGQVVEVCKTEGEEFTNLSGFDFTNSA